MTRKRSYGWWMNIMAVSAALLTSACATVSVPDSRNVDIPSPTMADSRKKAINERPDSVMYLPLGEDVLVPEVMENDSFPSEMVGPFELRGETLAGALQLILADYDISLAFETRRGLTRRITVANLRGDLGKVVHEVCSLANLYCSYEDGTITVKDRQTFTVTLPPIGTSEDQSAYLDDVAEGLTAILDAGKSDQDDEDDENSGSSSSSSSDDENDPIVDPTTRTIVYSATQRTADIASRYFQRLRASTAMIVFETYIWEVSLNSGNSTGIDWSSMSSFGKFNTSLSLDGSVGADFTNPISIGLPTTQDINGTPTDIIQFLSQFGAVKTISQPQITVLSGSEAELRVADTQNYVSQIATTLDEGQSTTSVNTDSVDTGFTLTIGSSWDKATVYANVDIELTDVKTIDDFTFSDTGDDGGQTIIQLPQTSERQLSTQIRVRPGDSVLIAGLVRENDNFDSEGVGFMKPLIPKSRTARTDNLELVILLRPRVIVYTASDDKRYIDYSMKKHKRPGTGVEVTSPKELGEPPVTTGEHPEPQTREMSPTEKAMPAMPEPLTGESEIGGTPAKPAVSSAPSAAPKNPAPVTAEPISLAPPPPSSIASPPMPTPLSPPSAGPPTPAPIYPVSGAAASNADVASMRESGFVSKSTESANVSAAPDKSAAAIAPAAAPAQPSDALLSAPPTKKD